MNRISKKFKLLQEQSKTAFIGYITAGDPNLDKTEQLVYAMEAGGADIVEIGIPFSDPLADGPVIQDAAIRALSGDINVSKIMDCVENIRKKSEVPLLYLVYINTILVYGKERFIKRCMEVGIDGLIIPDLPLEERDEILEALEGTNISLIPLVAPTSKDRMESIIKGCSGFVYCVSNLGVTGQKSSFHKDILTYLEDVKKYSHLPIAVGFGISSREDIESFKNYVDGVIVGSAIVKVVEQTNGDTEAVEKFISNMIG